MRDDGKAGEIQEYQVYVNGQKIDNFDLSNQKGPFDMTVVAKDYAGNTKVEKYHFDAEEETLTKLADEAKTKATIAFKDNSQLNFDVVAGEDFVLPDYTGVVPENKLFAGYRLNNESKLREAGETIISSLDAEGYTVEAIFKDRPVVKEPEYIEPKFPDKNENDHEGNTQEQTPQPEAKPDNDKEQTPQPEIIKDYFKLIADFDGEQVVYDRKDSDVWTSAKQAREVYDQYLPEAIKRDGKEYQRVDVTFVASEKEAILTYVFKLKANQTEVPTPPSIEESGSDQAEEKPQQPKQPEIDDNQSTGEVTDTTDEDNKSPDDSKIETGKGESLIRPDQPAFEGGVNHHKAATHEKPVFPHHQLQALLQVEKNNAITSIATLPSLNEDVIATYRIAIQQAENVPAIETIIRQAVALNEKLVVSTEMNKIADQKNNESGKHTIQQSEVITNKLPQSSNKQLTEKAEEQVAEGERLPDTATGSWILGLIGIFSTLVGVSIEKLRKD